MTSKEAFPPRVWVYFDNRNNMRVCHCVKKENFIPPNTSRANEGWKFLSVKEHTALIAEKDQRIRKLEDLMWDSIARASQDSTVTAPLREYFKNREALSEGKK